MHTKNDRVEIEHYAKVINLYLVIKNIRKVNVPIR